MPIIDNLWEGNDEAIGTNSSITRTYLVTILPNGQAPDFIPESDVESTVINALAGFQPELFSKYGRTFYRSEVSVDEHISQNHWKARVSWTTKDAEKKPPENPQQDYAPDIAMSSGGGSQHVTQSIATVGIYPPDATQYSAIGFDGKTVQGVDIMVPSIEFSETYTRDESWLSNYDVIRALTTKAGRVLSEEFRGFPSGEVMYKGCDISRSSNVVKFTYHFAVSPNREDIVIGDVTVGLKRGWEYLWVRYLDQWDETAQEVLKKPIAAYVEQMYEEVTMAEIYLANESSWITPPSGGPA